MNQLQNDLQTMKGRQSAAAAISVSQLLLVIAYLCVIGGIKIVKVFKKKQEKQLVANLELMESRLQERKKQEEVCRQATKGTVVLTSWSENSASKANLLSQ